MRYRDDRKRCPTCAEPAVGYDAMWDYLRCTNGHKWDGPINDPALRGKTLPTDPRRIAIIGQRSPDAGGPTFALGPVLGPVRLRGSGGHDS